MSKVLFFLLFSLVFFAQVQTRTRERANGKLRARSERQRQAGQIRRGSDFSKQGGKELEVKQEWKLWEKIVTGAFFIGLAIILVWAIYYVFSDRDRRNIFFRSFLISFTIKFVLGIFGIKSRY